MTPLTTTAPAIPLGHVIVEFGAGIPADAQGVALLAMEKILRGMGLPAEVFKQTMADDSKLRRNMTPEQRAEAAVSRKEQYAAMTDDERAVHATEAHLRYAKRSIKTKERRSKSLFITARQAALMLCVNDETFRNWIKRGHIAATVEKYPSGRHRYLLLRKEIEDFRDELKADGTNIRIRLGKRGSV